MKFYCEYCKSYLTHDKLSVRKSHLQGRNHIKLYCQYFEQKQKELHLSANDEIDLEYIYKDSPKIEQSIGEEDEDDEPHLPPPTPLKGFPKPPPSVLFNEQDKELILYYKTYLANESKY